MVEVKVEAALKGMKESLQGSGCILLDGQFFNLGRLTDYGRVDGGSALYCGLSTTVEGSRYLSLGLTFTNFLNCRWSL